MSLDIATHHHTSRIDSRSNEQDDKSTPLLLLAVGVASLAGCSTQGAGGLITDQTADEIPCNSNLILVNADVSSDSLYRAFHKDVESQGFMIINENDSEQSFETQPKGSGRRVVLEVDGHVSSASAGSTLRLKGRVGDKQMNQTAEALTDLEGGSGDGVRRATWYRCGDQQRGYAKLVQIA